MLDVSPPLGYSRRSTSLPHRSTYVKIVRTAALTSATQILTVPSDHSRDAVDRLKAHSHGIARVKARAQRMHAMAQSREQL